MMSNSADPRTPPMNSRDRAIRQASITQAQTRIALADQERAARTAPITVEVTGYDPDTGDYLADTPSGGQVRTRSLSNGPLSGSLPFQRQPGSQDSFVDAPPRDGDGTAIAQLQQQIIQLQGLVSRIAGVQIKAVNPTVAADARVLGDKWLNTSTDALFVWTGTDWIEVSGGGGGAAIQYHNGDPNHNSVTPISGRLYDIMAEREFIPGAGAVPTAWVPTAKIMFVFEGPIGQQYYPGDSYWGSDQCLQVFNGLDWEGSCSETGGPYGDGAYCGPPL